jgi:hypothetical protein
MKSSRTWPPEGWTSYQCAGDRLGPWMTVMRARYTFCGILAAQPVPGRSFAKHVARNFVTSKAYYAFKTWHYCNFHTPRYPSDTICGFQLSSLNWDCLHTNPETACTLISQTIHYDSIFFILRRDDWHITVDVSKERGAFIFRVKRQSILLVLKNRASRSFTRTALCASWHVVTSPNYLPVDTV